MREQFFKSFVASSSNDLDRKINYFLYKHREEKIKIVKMQNSTNQPTYSSFTTFYTFIVYEVEVDENDI